MTSAGAALDLPPWIEQPAAAPEFRPARNAWVLSRYADVSAAFRHTDVAAAEASNELRALTERAGIRCPFLETQYRGVLLNTNAPWHAVARRFSRAALRQMGNGLPPGAIGELADELLDALPHGEAFDVMPFCDDLPTRVTARGFGVEDALIREVAERATAIYASLRRGTPLRRMRQYETMSEELSRLMDDQLRGTPALDAVRQAGRDEYGLTSSEMNALLAFFVVAATETTSAFIGSAFHLLGMHPDATAAIRADSTRLQPTFDELMRYLAPGGTAVGLRCATAPIHLHGTTIPQGALLLLDIERAHFDPAVYPEPARFDPHRRGPPHLGFGGGAHACLGMAAARDQILALLARLVARFDIEPQSTALEWCDKSTMRRLRRLSITLHPRC